jgi:hypothetical protein
MICVIAINDKAYGRLAVNLVASLRFILPDERIVVISDGSFQACEGSELLNCEMIPAWDTNAFKMKAELGSVISDHCIYIDADTIVNDREAAVRAIGMLKQERFYIQEYARLTPGQTDPGAWGDPSAYGQHYGFTEKYPVYNSSVIAWEPEYTRELWEKAAECYSNPAPVDEDVNGYFPDEVAFGAASAMTGIYSENPQKVTWFRWHTDDFRGYPFISLAGGGHVRPAILRYNGIATRNAREMNLPVYKFEPRKKVAYGRK